jgi:hypothetical protein
VVPPVVPVAPLPDIELELSVPVTSTRLFTFDAERSDELPSRMYVEPMLECELGEVPAVELPVVPAVELVPEVEDEPLPVLAFVKMNDAPAPDVEPVLDAVEPVAAVPLVPVEPLASPRCRHPVTVIVPL